MCFFPLQLRDNESHVSFLLQRKVASEASSDSWNKGHFIVIMERQESVLLPIKDYPLWGSCRLTLVILGFFGAMLISILRFNFSMAIVCMTDEANDNGLEFNWNKSTQGYLLSAFFYGEYSTQWEALFQTPVIWSHLHRLHLYTVFRWLLQWQLFRKDMFTQWNLHLEQ